MNIKEIYNDLIKKIPPSNIKLEEEMKKYTSFKIGGVADILIIAKSVEDIKVVLEIVKKNKIPLTIIGNGTNLLVKDNGIRGIVLKIDLQEINIQKDEQDIEMQLIYDKVAEEEEEYKYNQDVIIELGAGVKLGMLARCIIKRRNRRI
ncbi:MAG: FAD-binding protein [Clostridia bacterium]|nr:FAD-binding protein [Clostridia bacterium]